MTKEKLLNLYQEESLGDWLNRLPERIDEILKHAFEEVIPKEKFCEHCDDKSVNDIQINIKKFLNK